MMGDLTVSEKRLIAALDRIDYTIERAAASLRGSVPAEAAEASTPAMQAENQRLVDELTAAQQRQEAALHALEVRLAQANARLDEAGQQAARLAAANEALTNANRQLLSKADSGGADASEIRTTLEAEIEALRAARAAEIAQMGDIIESIDRLVDTPAPRRPARTRVEETMVNDTVLEEKVIEETATTEKVVDEIKAEDPTEAEHSAPRDVAEADLDEAETRG